MAGCGAGPASSPATRDGVYACTFGLPDGGMSPWQCDIFYLDTGADMALFDAGSVSITGPNGTFRGGDIWSDAGSLNVLVTDQQCSRQQRLVLEDHGSALDFSFKSDCAPCGAGGGERVGSCVRK